MARGFQYARGAKTVPYVQSCAYATGQTFLKGALLVKNSAGEVVECGADPAAVYGVAAQDAGSGLGYGAANSAQTTVVTGRSQEVSVVVADRTSQFSARAVNGGTDPVIPLQTHIDEQYGVVKVGNDWVIDMAETTAKVVEIVDIVEPQGGQAGMFICKFLEAVLGSP